MEPAIEIHDLEVRYGAVVAVSGLNFVVPVGSSLAVVGTNGCGKSTLLATIAGLHKPTSGTTQVAGGRPAFVLQATDVDAGLPITVRDTVRLARYPSVGLFRRFDDADNEAVTRALDRMQVDHLASLPLHQLSGGERQRVLMAQGLAQESDVLLLDEPMTGLDVTSRRIVLDIIKEEVAAERTVVTTTHNMSDANESDLVLLLDTTAIAFGPPSSVLTDANLLRTFGQQVQVVSTP